MYFAIYFLILQLLRDPVPTNLMFFLSLKHNQKQIQKEKATEDTWSPSYVG